MLNEIYFTNTVYLTIAYLVCFLAVGYFLFRLWKRYGTHTRDTPVIKLELNRNGQCKVFIKESTNLTIGDTEDLIKQAIAELAYKDERLVRILFAESLTALMEDPKVRQLYKEITGNELRSVQ